MELRSLLQLLPAVPLLIVAGMPVSAIADGPATGMTLRAYVAATARVQDPAGSDWRTVETTELPRGVPVEHYQPGQWIDIRYQGRLIRIKLSNVYLQSVVVDGAPPVICPGGTAQAIPGKQGFGQECAQ